MLNVKHLKGMYPEITVPIRISRAFIQCHPDWSFVYSSNVFNSGRLGQAGQCSYEPNCYPVPVCVRFCRSNMDSYFSDSQFESFTKPLIDTAIARIPAMASPNIRNVVIVFPKIGTGFSQMNKLAPRTWEYLNEELSKIVYPNIKWDYYCQV